MANYYFSNGRHLPKSSTVLVQRLKVMKFQYQYGAVQIIVLQKLASKILEVVFRKFQYWTTFHVKKLSLILIFYEHKFSDTISDILSYTTITLALSHQLIRFVIPFRLVLRCLSLSFASIIEKLHRHILV